MKKLIIICMSAIMFFTTSIAISQTVDFKSQLGQTLNAINTNKNPQDLYANINKLKRISAMYSDEWLSDYYVALLDIKLSLATKDKSKKEALLNEAQVTIDALKQKKNAIESEVLTLQGYHYYARIASDPQTNGRLYYKDVIGTYQKAINIDKNNPRANLMLAIFQNNMSSFTGGGNMEGFCEQLQGIDILFENFKPKDKLHPKWGKNQLVAYQQKNCSTLKSQSTQD